MVIPVNSIEIPDRFVEVAECWHGGQGCMLYAISSTGGLTTGTNCPVLDYDDDADRMQKWYYTIWCDLIADVAGARRAAEKGYNAADEDDGGDGEGHDADYPVLVEFEEWVDMQVGRLCEAYGLEDWEG